MEEELEEELATTTPRMRKRKSRKSISCRYHLRGIQIQPIQIRIQIRTRVVEDICLVPTACKRRLASSAKEAIDPWIY